ncbi:MAG: lysophospholipid acyltransferase family protein [Anderseniella sp.]|jgi:1-acyl-sn-glycerol-3-phosphate acyltransferase|nr:lysophospholipid acyltransferase family protein [Anderseniella sp.]
MLVLRSLLFNTVFYLNLIVFLVGGFWFMFTPRKWSMWALKQWARASLWWLKVIAGTRMEVRGREHIPQGPALLAGKHQSLWDIFALLPLLDDPALVLKKELTLIPLFGWFCLKFRMIAVDRSAGTSALKKMTADAKHAVAGGRQVMIFPEGTRSAPGAAPDYKPGAAALYMHMGVPCTPFALNSGLFWPRRRFIRRPGTIVVEFLPAIEPGLDRKTFSARLEHEIETATTSLLREAGDTPG